MNQSACVPFQAYTPSLRETISGTGKENKEKKIFKTSTCSQVLMQKHDLDTQTQKNHTPYTWLLYADQHADGLAGRQHL